MPIGEFDALLTASTFYGVYVLGLLHALRRLAPSSLSSFRPALAGDEKTYQGLHYQLTTIPARGSLLATAVGLLGAVAAVLFDRNLVASFTVTPGSTIVSTLLIYWAVVLVPIVFYSSVRQLLLVAHIHRTLTQHLPLCPRASVLVRCPECDGWAGIGVLNYYSVLTDPTTFTNPIWLAVLIISVLLAVGCSCCPFIECTGESRPKRNYSRPLTPGDCRGFSTTFIPVSIDST